MLKKRAGQGRLAKGGGSWAFVLATSACYGPDVAADKANSPAAAWERAWARSATATRATPGAAASGAGHGPYQAAVTVRASSKIGPPAGDDRGQPGQAATAGGRRLTSPAAVMAEFGMRPGEWLEGR